jgi:hypothetical protein
MVFELRKQSMEPRPGGGRSWDGQVLPLVPIYADYEGHRTQALYFAPARVEIVDGPLKGESFRTSTGAARAVVRHYNPSVNDNRNGWGFWQIDNGGGPRVWLQSIRPA